MEDSTKRFSNRVENYVKYRPHYPKEIITFLTNEIGLTPQNIIADIGSGTGISSELFLQNGNKVYGIEPNKEMREAGEKYLEKYDKFLSVAGTAEDTLLESDSMDIIVCGQAFHWFDTDKCKIEFTRIIKNNGYVVLIWNERNTENSPLLTEYENLIKKFGTDYDKVSQKDEEVNEKIKIFFDERGYKTKHISNYQLFDFEGFKGRLLSSSYVPSENEVMIVELKELFDKYQKDGNVKFEYDTNIFYGQLK
ncbi:MAG: class I SAM-dependent methyltransferase [Bacteroidetes bacterium]|nr:class I SAM-dependent methyltransferase [Bacteroidota bacterium]